MSLLAMTNGQFWTLVAIVVVCLVFGVLVLSGDDDWFA